MLGPSGMSMAISKTSSNLNKLETGYLYHYTFLILIGSTLLLGIRQFWLVFGSFVDYRAAIIFFIFSFIIININNNEATHFPRLELMPSRVLNFPDKSQNQTRVFDFVMLLLGAVFFFYQWYVLSIYALTAVVYMKYFSEIFPTTKTMLLAEYNQIDNTKYDGLLIDRYLVIFFVIVALIGFAFDIWIAKFYTILVIISVIARLFGFQLSVLFPSIIGFIKQVQKDRATLRYHWYTDFKICRNIIHISLISLVLSVIFALGASVFMNVPEDVQSLNTQLWLYMVLIHCFFGFSLDVYIILFKNLAIQEKIVLICQRCAVYGGTGAAVNQELVDRGWLNPNLASNKIRSLLGRPQAVDWEQIKGERTLLKYRPETQTAEYTTRTPSGHLQIDSNKLIQLGRDNRDNFNYATRSERQAVGLKPKWFGPSR